MRTHFTLFTDYIIFSKTSTIHHLTSHLQHIPKYRPIILKSVTFCHSVICKKPDASQTIRSASDVNPSHTFYRIHHFFQIHTLSVILPVIYSIFQDTDRQSPKRQKLCHSVFCKKTDASQTIRSASVQLLFCHFLFSPFSPKYQPSIILPVIYSIFQDTDRQIPKTKQSVKRTNGFGPRPTGRGSRGLDPAQLFRKIQITPFFPNPHSVHHLTSHLHYIHNSVCLLPKTKQSVKRTKRFRTEANRPRILRVGPRPALS
jgi:hypothetical protein